jgi:hypothetical protein
MRDVKPAIARVLVGPARNSKGAMALLRRVWCPRPMSPLPGAWHAAPRCRAVRLHLTQGYTPRNFHAGRPGTEWPVPDVSRSSEAWRAVLGTQRPEGGTSRWTP